MKTDNLFKTLLTFSISQHLPHQGWILILCNVCCGVALAEVADGDGMEQNLGKARPSSENHRSLGNPTNEHKIGTIRGASILADKLP